MNKNRLMLCIGILTFFAFPAFSQKVSSPLPEADTLVSGYEAYRNEDWTSAMFFFRKAVSVSGSVTDETWFMLIMSEVYAGEFKSALGDCDVFLHKYPYSMYLPHILYQKGRCQHFLHQNEAAVLTLSDFCHQYPDHALYASALYWIAESFYAEYNYNSARGLYERIVMDYPHDAKVSAAQYRIDAIDQKSREEKLLYLLKVTGEENLAAREEYERQIKLFEAEDKLGLHQQLDDARKRIQMLEIELEARKKAPETASTGGVLDFNTGDGKTDANADYKGTGSYYSTPYAPRVQARGDGDPEVEALKRKARQLQYMMIEEERNEGDAK